MKKIEIVDHIFYTSCILKFFDMPSLAMKLTIGRFILVVPAITFLWIPGYRWVAFLLFVILAVMDALDGYYARKRGEVTRLGTILDPAADKLNVLALLVALPMIYPYFPVWFSVIIIGRDFLMVAGWALHYYLSGNIIMIPSKLGKFTMTIQYSMIGLCVLMSVLYLDHDVDPLKGRILVAEAVFLGVAFLTILTTVDYFFNMVHHGLKVHPDITSPMEKVKARRDVKRAAKNKPPAKRRVMTHIYKRTEERKKEPKHHPEVIEEFKRFRVCQICQGSMRKGHVAQCRCGRYFHLGCLATMNGECPTCGTVIQLDEDTGAADDKMIMKEE